MRQQPKPTVTCHTGSGRAVSTAVLAGLLGMTLLAGCGDPNTPANTNSASNNQTSATSGASASPTAADSSISTTPAAGYGGGPQAPAATTAPPVDVSQAAQDGAKAFAVKVMILYARPAVPAAKWKAELAPLATPEFVVENARVNPAFVGVSKVVSAGDWVKDKDNPYTVQIPVTTDAGVFIVQLHRGNGTTLEGWKVRYVIPPTLRK